MNHSTLKGAIEDLTGQEIPLQENSESVRKNKITHAGLGYSQFNELMLFLGYDRVNHSFFQFLVDGTLEYKPTMAIRELKDFSKQVNKIIEYALRLFGNIKYAYKEFSGVANDITFTNWYTLLQPVDKVHYTSRHVPLFALKKIANDDTYFLGYIIQRDINDRLKGNPGDVAAKKMKVKMDETIQNGAENHKAYLASDHMDVYVATSMRQRHEYLFVSRITDELFSHKHLQPSKVRSLIYTGLLQRSY